MERIFKVAQKMTALVLALGMMMAAFPTSAFADAARVVTLGADLTAEQRATVLNFFGLSESELNNLQVITVTNQDERAHLSSSIDLGIIGNRTYSCSYIQPTTSGGIYVQTANLNYVTNYMLYNALQTAGVKNCNLVVTAPFPVSGTGALTGVFMAYESQGQNLDDAKEKVATEELVTTAQLGETYGDNVAEVISDVKDKAISSGNNLSDDEIRDIVRKAAESKGINLSDEDLDRVVQLVRSLMELDYDPNAFAQTLSDFESRLDEVTKKAEESGILDGIAGFFKGVYDWVMGLVGGGQAPTAEEVSQSAEDFFSNFNTDVYSWDSTQ